MPTYEYRCHFCNHLLEEVQKMSDSPLVKCPFCGKDELERIVSGGAGVIYKGEGWYVTDYSKKSSGGKDDSDKPLTKKVKTETSASASSTESKPETESKAAEKPISPPKANTTTSKQDQ
jgi:putative FmdB family regulatory protein